MVRWNRHTMYTPDQVGSGTRTKRKGQCKNARETVERWSLERPILPSSQVVLPLTPMELVLVLDPAVDYEPLLRVRPVRFEQSVLCFAHATDGMGRPVSLGTGTLREERKETYVRELSLDCDGVGVRELGPLVEKELEAEEADQLQRAGKSQRRFARPGDPKEEGVGETYEVPSSSPVQVRLYIIPNWAEASRVGSARARGRALFPSPPREFPSSDSVVQIDREVETDLLLERDDGREVLLLWHLYATESKSRDVSLRTRPSFVGGPSSPLPPGPTRD